MQLRDLQIQAGAVFDEANPERGPIRYGDTSLEYQVVERGVGIVDRSLRGKLRMTGKDRARFLHGMVTNTVEGLAEWGGNHAALTTVKGETLLDLWVHHLGDCLWLETEPQYQTTLYETLDRYLIADDVVMTDETDAWVTLGIVGALADETVNDILGTFSSLAENHIQVVEWTGTTVWITRRSLWGREGYDLRVSVADGGKLWHALLEAGGLPIGLEAQEVLRVEAGVPCCGYEIDESVTPLEAGLPDTVDFDKGCYIGQEVIAKMHFRGKPRRYLVGIEVECGDILCSGEEISVGDKTVGRVTSCVFSPKLEQIIALAIVRRGMHEVGQSLRVGKGAAKVVALPFVAVKT